MSIICVLSILVYGHHFFLFTTATPLGNIKDHEILPTINDDNLKVEPIFSGTGYPSSMAFLGPDDILLLDKNKGTVHRIVNGAMLEEPMLEVNVSGKNERGILGIAISNNDRNSDICFLVLYSCNNPTYVFLYYTEVKRDGVEDKTVRENLLGNRLYSYEIDNNNNKLVNPKLLLDLPALPATRHNGGAIIIDPDDNVYVPIGDVSGYLYFSGGDVDLSEPASLPFLRRNAETLAQNINDGKNPDGRSGILRVTIKGEALKDEKAILGDGHPLDMYYAYGIRNSFGLDFDPMTGKLWDTENGPSFGDEINLVEPGFNSGWRKVQGIWEVDIIKNNTNDGEQGDVFEGDESSDYLVNFDGGGKYSSPEFTWQESVGVTAIKFLNSDRYGEDYVNDMFVGDFNNGYLYHFNLSKDRSQLILGRPLDDKIANSTEELEGIIFARGFGSITDLEVNPYDGNLYVLSVRQEQGSSSNCNDKESYNSDCSSIFRIIPDTHKK